ncbi:MAG: TIGR03560 family F420-dependent LLM class oxidoreductase [Acidimicrobiia bacterium]|nr:TIGR03560 family F420-dependent LLM class oxidoreductase [Actinomycetota bacterium]NDE58340.1 TIGR03560 family F420-dependent LLM class oxidoreductase [Acidimicrobiia bacterium]NDE80171.1 TIGR03560 family F420-dependent LLM class oxidoreductase [Actinomycetota bacterium]NDH47511.1 TIGR03560 family F420-dependent LLM class oxidoreductase [Acidimicrobiia bacterium]
MTSGMFPTVRFGVHTGLQHTTYDVLQPLWKRIEELGFDWISIWDHFYGATGKPDDAACYEAVAMHTALAAATEKVRVGSLVYSVGYRHPAVLAKMITAIDHISGGRADLGLGAGWAVVEYDAYGIPFPGVKTRMDQLEEAIQCVRGLLHDDVTNFEGEWFSMKGARNEPRPIQSRLPIWVGGGGEKRTLNIAARYADGWNVPFISPEAFAHKSAVLTEHCVRVGRDPKSVKRTVNVGIAWTEESLRAQFGMLADGVRPGVLTGSDDEVIDRIGQYVEAGAEQINLALRAPFDRDALERFSGTLALK